MSQKVSPRELIDATRQLAVLARLGYPMAEGLRQIGEDGTPWLGDLGERLEEGDTLTQAVGRYPRVFSSFYQGMVKAAEEAEQSGGILSSLGDWLERADELRRESRQVAVYPYLLLNALLFYLILLFHSIVPEVLIPLAQSSGLAMPAPAATLASVSGGLALVAVMGLVLVNLAALGSQGLEAAFLRRLPGLGGVFGLADQALWARAAGSLVAAGVELPEAIEQASGVVGSETLNSEFTRVAERVRKGSRLSEALAEARYLEPYLAWAAISGEERGDVASTLLKSSEHLEERLNAQVAHRLQMLEPVLVFVLGVTVLIGLMAFWWPFYAATSALS